MLGHEPAGVIVEVGPACTTWRVGQRVVNSQMISDGTCPSCAAGRVTQCEGRSLFGYSGVYPRGSTEVRRSSYECRTPIATLRALPDTVSDEAASSLADILPTGRGSVSAAASGRRAPSSWSAAAGRADGDPLPWARARHVIAVDGIAERREAARPCSGPGPLSRPLPRALSPRRPLAWALTS